MQIKVTEQYNIIHIAIIATCIIQCMTMAIVRTDYNYDCVILLTMQWLQNILLYIQDSGGEQLTITVSASVHSIFCHEECHNVIAM